MPLPPYPVLPNPYGWGANGPEPVLAPTLRTDVANAVNLFGNPPLFVGNANIAQSIAASTITAVSLNNTVTDPWVGHNVATNTTNYYFPIPGWYLCEGSVPGGGTGGSGTQTTGFGFVAQGAPIAYSNGGRTKVEGTSPAHPTGAFLIQAFNVPSTDYVQMITYQTTSGSQNTIASASKYPMMSCQWIAMPTSDGVAPLTVPANPSWPVPPAYITSSFLNANIQQTIQYLGYPPFCQYVYPNTTTGIPNNTITALTGAWTASVDNYSIFTPATATVTIPRAGLWYFYGLVCFTDSSITTGTSRAAVLSVSSANYAGAANIWGNTEIPCTSSGAALNPGHNSVVHRRLRLNAGDTVQLCAFQTDSSSGTRQAGTSNNNISRFIAVWRSS